VSIARVISGGRHHSMIKLKSVVGSILGNGPMVTIYISKESYKSGDAKYRIFGMDGVIFCSSPGHSVLVVVVV
jgi:hypothetical protein